MKLKIACISKFHCNFSCLKCCFDDLDNFREIFNEIYNISLKVDYNFRFRSELNIMKSNQLSDI